MMEIEKTLVLIKPDGVQKAIVGRIISRFEETGLKIIGMKMVWVDEEFAEKHYPLDEVWAKNVYDKTKKVYDSSGKKMKQDNHIEFGKTIQKWNMNFLKEGPIVAIVLEGPHAIDLVRKMIGATEPRQAAPGTIRGDFASVESYILADAKERAVRNLLHASDSVEGAKREIDLWFSEFEIHNYENALDKHF
ncbi:MAG: nucleoside-diphosphate kinase [Nanoarchaeota archaeon]|nr:nucleoside-diphosphate kinase [Nanoarchaeota archaeon]